MEMRASFRYSNLFRNVDFQKQAFQLTKRVINNFIARFAKHYLKKVPTNRFQKLDLQNKVFKL